jgi:hypothetical protein
VGFVWIALSWRDQTLVVSIITPTQLDHAIMASLGIKA